MSELVIEEVDSTWAERMIGVHYDAVHHGRAGLYYDADILGDWSPPPSLERTNAMARRLEESGAVALAASFEYAVAGFGILDPKESRIGAVYVRPGYSRKGIGRMLLATLEQKAVQAGIGMLSLESSLNAVRFYALAGYLARGRGTFTLGSGRRMDCVMMEKRLEPLRTA